MESMFLPKHLCLGVEGGRAHVGEVRGEPWKLVVLCFKYSTYVYTHYELSNVMHIIICILLVCIIIQVVSDTVPLTCT